MGVGREGVVAVDDKELFGLRGSESSRFRGRNVPKNIFFSPARDLGDLGDVLGIETSDTGEEAVVERAGDLGVVEWLEGLLGENLEKLK